MKWCHFYILLHPKSLENVQECQDIWRSTPVWVKFKLLSSENCGQFLPVNDLAKSENTPPLWNYIISSKINMVRKPVYNKRIKLIYWLKKKKKNSLEATREFCLFSTLDDNLLKLSRWISPVENINALMTDLWLSEEYWCNYKPACSLTLAVVITKGVGTLWNFTVLEIF